MYMHNMYMYMCMYVRLYLSFSLLYCNLTYKNSCHTSERTKSIILRLFPVPRVYCTNNTTVRVRNHHRLLSSLASSADVIHSERLWLPPSPAGEGPVDGGCFL
jgi:hypothetical protein